jgi:E3 ubiquitin-protein ligase makorin
MEMVMSGVIKSCPSCRTQSHYVVPSSVFYREGDPKKERTITTYKETLARTPCRRFEENLRLRGRAFCPFGRDCFYRHLDEDGTVHVFEQGIEETMQETRLRREQAEARRRARQMRDLTATLSAFAESLLLNDPDALAEFDDDDEFDEEEEEEYESEWADGDDVWGAIEDWASLW